ncbi:N-lysine methyltransferase KMT5A [Pimephales promelas]|nr:N-lysine methyltransferase KMT5A [Pimephales promelas]
MLRKKRIKPEQDAKEHILSDKDKAFIEGRQINTFKGRVNMLKMFKATTCSTSHGMKHVIDATKEDTSLGPLRLVNDDKNPNCKVKTIIVDGRPHLCLFSIRHIFPDEEVTYNYGDSSWPWRLRELCDETSVAVTECSVNPSSSVKQKELCDETSVAVTECSVNPSSSVKQKELCDETSVAVTECSVNPSSSVKQKSESRQAAEESEVDITVRVEAGSRRIRGRYNSPGQGRQQKNQRSIKQSVNGVYMGKRQMNQDETENSRETKSRRIAKRPWSPNEDNAFVKHFHISKGHLATKAECELCKTAEDPVLRERMAQNIRHFVRNRGGPGGVMEGQARGAEEGLKTAAGWKARVEPARTVKTPWATTEQKIPRG